jgi:hypothetical protein
MHHESDAKRTEALAAAVAAIDSAALQAAGDFLPAVPPFFFPSEWKPEGRGGQSVFPPLCITGAAMQVCALQSL